MKNIQVVDGANNTAYDIFAATDEEFKLIFPADTDIAFIDEVIEREAEKDLNEAFGGSNTTPHEKTRRQSTPVVHACDSNLTNLESL